MAPAPSSPSLTCASREFNAPCTARIEESEHRPVKTKSPGISTESASSQNHAYVHLNGQGFQEKENLQKSGSITKEEVLEKVVRQLVQLAGKADFLNELKISNLSDCEDEEFYRTLAVKILTDFNTNKFPQITDSSDCGQESFETNKPMNQCSGSEEISKIKFSSSEQRSLMMSPTSESSKSIRSPVASMFPHKGLSPRQGTMSPIAHGMVSPVASDIETLTLDSVADTPPSRTESGSLNEESVTTNSSCNSPEADIRNNVLKAKFTSAISAEALISRLEELKKEKVSTPIQTPDQSKPIPVKTLGSGYLGSAPSNYFTKNDVDPSLTMSSSAPNFQTVSTSTPDLQNELIKCQEANELSWQKACESEADTKFTAMMGALLPNKNYALGMSADLQSFCAKWPKVDLHTHASGALTADDYVQAALQLDFNWDYENNRFTKQAPNPPTIVPVRKIMDKGSSNRDTRAKWHQKIEHLIQARVETLLNKQVEHPGCENHDCSKGHTNFFAVWEVISELADEIRANGMGLPPIMKKDLDQEMIYRELMTEFADKPKLPDGYEKAYEKGFQEAFDFLKDKGWLNDYQKRMQSQMDFFDRITVKHVKAKYDAKKNGNNQESLNNFHIPALDENNVPLTSVDGEVTYRWCHELMRNACVHETFADAAATVWTIIHEWKTKKLSRLCSFNLVGPELDINSRENFREHLEMIEFFKKYAEAENYHLNLTVHAGEMNTSTAQSKNDTYPVTQLIELVERIGHGASVLGEPNFEELIERIRVLNRYFEVCPSSNMSITGMPPQSHPFNTFWKYRIPFGPHTDDPAIFTTTAGRELAIILYTIQMGYRQATKSTMSIEEREKLKPTYKHLKSISRWGIEHSFLPGESVYQKDEEGLLEFKEPFCNVPISQWKKHKDTAIYFNKDHEMYSEKVCVCHRLETKITAYEQSFVRNNKSLARNTPSVVSPLKSSSP